MLVVLMLFCAAGAVLLIALGAYAEFQELWPHSAKHSAVPHPSDRRHAR
jgi:hypothetical protein